MEFYLDFMTPDVWNGLVIGVILIGLSLAILRLYGDLFRPPYRRADPQTENNTKQDEPPEDD